MKIVLAICCAITLGKAFPVEDINLVKFYSNGPQQRTDKLDSVISHKRIAREISDYYFGANTYQYPYPYQIPSKLYYWSESM